MAYVLEIAGHDRQNVVGLWDSGAIFADLALDEGDRPEDLIEAVRSLLRCRNTLSAICSWRPLPSCVSRLNAPHRGLDVLPHVDQVQRREAFRG